MKPSGKEIEEYPLLQFNLNGSLEDAEAEKLSASRAQSHSLQCHLEATINQKSAKGNESSAPSRNLIPSFKTVKLRDFGNVALDASISTSKLAESIAKGYIDLEDEESSQKLKECEINSFFGESLMISICGSSICCCCLLPLSLTSVYLSFTVEALVRKRHFELATRYVFAFILSI